MLTATIVAAVCLAEPILACEAPIPYAGIPVVLGDRDGRTGGLMPIYGGGYYFLGPVMLEGEGIDIYPLSDPANPIRYNSYVDRSLGPDRVPFLPLPDDEGCIFVIRNREWGQITGYSDTSRRDEFGTCFYTVLPDIYVPIRGDARGLSHPASSDYAPQSANDRGISMLVTPYLVQSLDFPGYAAILGLAYGFDNLPVTVRVSIPETQTTAEVVLAEVQFNSNNSGSAWIHFTTDPVVAGQGNGAILLEELPTDGPIRVRIVAPGLTDGRVEFVPVESKHYTVRPPMTKANGGDIQFYWEQFHNPAPPAAKALLAGGVIIGWTPFIEADGVYDPNEDGVLDGADRIAGIF